MKSFYSRSFLGLGFQFARFALRLWKYDSGVHNSVNMYGPASSALLFHMVSNAVSTAVCTLVCN